MSRRRLLKAGIYGGVASLLTGCDESESGSAAEPLTLQAPAKKPVSARTGGGIQAATGPFGYTPFTASVGRGHGKQTGLPVTLNRSSVDMSNGPLRGTIHNDVVLDPVPGTPEAAVGSEDRVHVGGKTVDRAVYHGIAPEYDPLHPIHKAVNDPSVNPDPNHRWDRFAGQLPSGQGPNASEVHYALAIARGYHEFIPGIQTAIFGYTDAGEEGIFPAPTIVARHGQPAVVRATNELGEVGDLEAPECSIHDHGGHNAAHADGYPDFYILPGRTRDYYYTNTAPKQPESGEQDPEKCMAGPFPLSDIPTTMWYHDHGMDITGYLVSRGLAGFYLSQDDHEIDLIERRILPPFYNTWEAHGDAGPTDIPLALMDQKFDATGTKLPYDFLDHNGRLGDVMTVNGVAQPYMEVERRKYRFRFLNASNARVYQLELSNKMPFVQIGQDSWELPEAFARKNFPLVPAQRVDCIVDFSKASPGDEIYLNNIMEQKDGRGPKRINRRARTPLMKFIVAKGPAFHNDITVEAGTLIREHTRLDPKSAVATRYFDLQRRNGAWQINKQFFSPRRSNAVPILNTTERWIFKNKSGGWVHPMHLHLEAHQIQKYNGKRPPRAYRGNVDISHLEPNGEVELLVNFRTFTGPYVFHCHTLEHEDLRMMGTFDPRRPGEPSLNDGERPHSDIEFEDRFGYSYQQVSGMVENEEIWEEEERHLFFDEEGDVELLEDREVGFPATDFAASGQTEPGPPAPDAPDNHDD